MSRIFEALQQSVAEVGRSEPPTSIPLTKPSELTKRVPNESVPRAGSSFSISCPPEKRLVAVSDRLSLGAEKLRILSTRLKYAQQRRSFKKLLITSTIRGEGKTTVAANLGVILAQQRQNVLLIDGDLHQPALSELFGLGGRPGLSDWWREQQEINGYFCRAEGLPLWFLTGGTPVDQPLTMLHSPEVSQLISTLSGWFDWVIIDSPPLAPLADASVWCNITESILLVSRQGITPKKLLEQSMGSLEKAKILGVVLNQADSTEHRYYADYYRPAAEGNRASGPRPAPVAVAKPK
jgi:protein-tyrosine kinase